MTPGHPACASSALPNVCFYWNNNHHNNNRWGPAMPALLAGMMPWATSLIAGNREVLWRAGTDGMARRQARGQGARKLQSLELTALTRPCRILLDWHFSDGKLLHMCVEEQYHFEQRAPSLPGWTCLLAVLLGAGLRGQGRLLPWGSTEVSGTDSSAKGTRHPDPGSALQETRAVTALPEYGIWSYSHSP